MLKLGDVATTQELATFRGHTELISSLTFSPDGKTSGSAGDGSLRLSQAAADKRLGDGGQVTVVGHRDRFRIDSPPV
jgi:WD40 repeat protein